MDTRIALMALLDPSARHREDVWPVRVAHAAQRLLGHHAMAIEHVVAHGDLVPLLRQQSMTADAMIVVDIYGLGWASQMAGQRFGKPTVFIGLGPAPEGIPSVIYGQDEAGSDAMEALLDSGVQRVACYGSLDHEWARARERGASAVLAHRGLPQMTNLGRIADHPDGGGPQALLAQGIGAGWGILAWDGKHGLIAARSARSLVGIPIQLMSFDEFPEADGLCCSTIDPPLEEAGLSAAHLVVAMIRGRSVPQSVQVAAQIRMRRPKVTSTPTLQPDGAS